MAVYRAPVPVMVSTAPQMAFVGPQMVPAPQPPKFRFGTCKGKNTIGVLRPNGFYYVFTQNSYNGHLNPHECLTCQPRINENNLSPLYAIWCEPISKYVIFAYNSISNKVEQYVFSFKTGGFEEVERHELVYNPANITSSNIVIVLNGDGNEKVLIERDQYGWLRKQSSRFGQFSTLQPVAVKTMMMKNIEERMAFMMNSEKEEESEYSEDEEEEEEDSNEEEKQISEDVEFEEYLKTVPALKLRYCPHTHQEVISSFCYFTKSYNIQYYNDYIGRFDTLNCSICKETITEMNLIPKYAEISGTDNKLVIHVQNTETSGMEQYIYNEKTKGFEQVNYSELVYDSSKNTDAVILYILMNQQIVLMRDSNGRIRKEQYCQLKNKYVFIPPVAVKTFLIQRKEAEKMKIVEKKLKEMAEKKKELLMKRSMESSSKKKISSGEPIFKGFQNMSVVDLGTDSDEECLIREGSGQIKKSSIDNSSKKNISNAVLQPIQKEFQMMPIISSSSSDGEDLNKTITDSVVTRKVHKTRESEKSDKKKILSEEIASYLKKLQNMSIDDSDEESLIKTFLRTSDREGSGQIKKSSIDNPKNGVTLETLLKENCHLLKKNNDKKSSDSTLPNIFKLAKPSVRCLKPKNGPINNQESNNSTIGNTSARDLDYAKSEKSVDPLENLCELYLGRKYFMPKR